MKNLILLLLGMIVFCQANSQNMNDRYTLNKDKLSFAEIIKEIETATGFLFSYDASIIPSKSKHSIHANQQSLHELLDGFFTPLQINHKISGSSIILTAIKSKKKYTLSGTIKDEENGETIIGASVRIESIKKGAITNAYGFYSITLEEDEYDVSVSYIGYIKEHFHIQLNKNIDKNVKLEQSQGSGLKELVIKANRTSVKEFTGTTQMGKLDIPVNMMKKVPTIAGESDVLKVLQLTPGIKRGGEGTIGMYVRGGGADENLILLDEATVYNAGHLLGFFSVFNTSAIKDVNMYKAGFPSNYGGRLSSILDLRMKDGNKNKFQTEGSLGLISSNLCIQGPIVKDKVSFLVAGRRTYIDKVFSAVGVKLPYYFYDVNAKLNWNIGKRDRIFISNYLGNDVLRPSDALSGNSGSGSDGVGLETDSKLGNFTSSLRWNHIFKNKKIFLNTTLLQTRFRYYVSGDFTGSSIKLESRIQDYGAKFDFNYHPNPNHQMKFGLDLINHTFKPNSIATNGDLDSLLSDRKNSATINSTETAIYALDDWEINKKIQLNYGLRLSSTYTQNTFYAGLEPRLALRYQLASQHSIKLSYARMKQYMHLVSSSSVALPTDLWYPVTKTVKPETSDQLSVGYYTGIEKANLLFSVELYYKKLQNLIEYKEGAVLLLNDNFEKELVRGNGDAYGIEFFTNKTLGRFTGWVGYTLSWATRQFDSLNKGKTYYAKYDRRHDISIVAMYDLSKRISVSAVWVLSSGNPFTARIGQYVVPNPGNNGIATIPIYSDRNAYRLATSHRLDIDFCLKRRPTRRWTGEWHFGVYNAYNRTQPSRVRLKFVDGTYKYQQTGLFGFIPSISYNFKF